MNSNLAVHMFHHMHKLVREEGRDGNGRKTIVDSFAIDRRQPMYRLTEQHCPNTERELIRNNLDGEYF